MEPSIPFVQHHQFQHCQVPSDNVEKDTGKTGEERLMGKSRPTLNLVFSKTVAISSAAQSSNAPNYPGIVRAPCQSLRLTACVEKPAAKGSDIVDVDSKEPNNFQISVSHILRKSSQSCVRKLVANQGTTRTTSIRIR